MVPGPHCHEPPNMHTRGKTQKSTDTIYSSKIKYSYRWGRMTYSGSEIPCVYTELTAPVKQGATICLLSDCLMDMTIYIYLNIYI